ncbi:hypothetical protein SELMODRAFT_412494 [Selaginella moellendorffii]|uniref:Uncharacterized protein n=1 Tax=Selaginella moellendorffii TaxID=88036 RepID=D8RLN3_SELML|nr:hypothetical protein SELMODRAFT_412494 [Selaginella moellendorffii]
MEDEVMNFLKDFKVDGDLLLGLEEFKGEFSNLQGQGAQSDLGKEQNTFAMELEQQMEEESPILALNEENNFAKELEWEIKEEFAASRDSSGFYELCDHKRAPELAGARGNRGHLAPSLLNFAALQRGFTAVPVVLYLLVTRLACLSLSVKSFCLHLLPQELGDPARLIHCYGKDMEAI